MKKLFLLLFSLILVFGFAGCNSSASELELDMDEFISSPTNLVISGTVLSWDAVTDASGYIVYANSEEVKKVTTNSYDFSSLEGDKLIFQVRTRAPRGMQDSALSASIAHVANKTQEIANINISLQSHGYSEMLPDGFAQELVNKGMIGSEVETMLNSMDTFMTSMDGVNSLPQAYALVDDFMADIDNIEALVSAFVKTVLVEALQMQIDNLEEEILWYEDEMDDYWVEMMVQDMQTQLDMYQAILDQIEDDPEAMVMTITTTIEYFMSIEELITSDLISKIDALADDTPGTVNVEELLVIKDEIVSILRETMPTQEDMLLMYQMYNMLTTAAGSSVDLTTSIDNYSGKMAAQALLSLEAFINFIDGLDNAYFTDTISEINSVKSDEMISAEIAIINIKYFASFKADNDDLLNEIGDVFTDEEEEIVFNQSISMLDTMEGMDEDSTAIIMGMLSNVNFQTILELQIILEDSFDAFLDAFVDSDGEIIRKVVISQNFANDYWLDAYTNYALNEQYETYSEYAHERTLAEYEVLGEVAYLLDAVLQTMNTANYQTVFDFILSLVPTQEMIMDDYNSPDRSDGMYAVNPLMLYMFGAYIPVFEEIMDESAAEQLELLQNIVEYVVDNDVFADYYQLEVDLYDYSVAEYGPEFRDSYDGYHSDSYVEYAELIFMAGVYDGFMTNGNRGLIDDIIDAVALALTNSEEPVGSEEGLTAAEIATMKTNALDLLDYISDQFDGIKDLNPENLSVSDIASLEAFFAEIGIKLYSITMDQSNTKS